MTGTPHEWSVGSAERGLLAARLAMRGFSSNPEVIEGRQGYGDAAASGRESLHWERLAEQCDRYMILDTLFKYHAACYLTHSAIESASALRSELEERGVAPEQLQRAVVNVHPGLLDVCGIPNPTTGLEAKFSLRATTSLALLGFDTSDAATFVDATLEDERLRALIDRVEVKTDKRLSHTQAMVELDAEGLVISHEHDSGVPAKDLEAQGARLSAKMIGLVAPLIGADASERLKTRVLDLESVSDVRELV